MGREFNIRALAMLMIQGYEIGKKWVGKEGDRKRQALRYCI